MYHYEYATKSSVKPVVNEFIGIINAVQDLLREEFTFSYDFIGSRARNMITYDPKTNVGFDLDMNLHINENGYRKYTPLEIKEKIKYAFNRVYQSRGMIPGFFYKIEDSTRVITIKKMTNDLCHSVIEYSCDFGIVHDIKGNKKNKRHEYILFDKKNSQYVGLFNQKDMA